MTLKNTCLPALALAPLALALTAHPVRAAGLLGTPVTGSLVFSGNGINFFDPVEISVYDHAIPDGDLNARGTTVAVSAAATEFGFDDGLNVDTADFTSNGLTFTDVALSPGVNESILATFTDPAFFGLTLAPVSDAFPGASAGLTGDTLTFAVPQITQASGTHTAVFNIAAPAVPEAPAGALLALGLLPLAGLSSARRSRVQWAHG